MIKDFGEFSKPILAALTALQDRTVNRWLEWQAHEDYANLLMLCLMTQTETGVRRRVLWNNWDLTKCVGMDRSLIAIGYGSVLFGGIELLAETDEPVPFWRLPADMAHLDRSKK